MSALSFPPPLPSPVHPPAYALYDVPAVGVATFLGSPLAGASVMAINYKRLGRSGAAWATILCGLGVTALMIGIGSVLPANMGGMSISVGGIIGAIAAAKSLQGETLAAHKQAGGKVGSTWMGAGIGAAFLVLIVAAIFGVVMLLPPLPGTHYAAGKHDEIYYSGTATEADAQALATKLQAAGFFDDEGSTVQLIRGDVTVVGFTVHDGAWDKELIREGFTEIAREIAPAIGGLPIEVRMLDDTGETRHRWTVK